MSLSRSIEKYHHILRQNSFAHLASILPDGRPHVTPVWYHFDPVSEMVQISMFANSQKDRNLQQDPRVAISITNLQNPYNYLQIQGIVENREVDEGGKFADFLTNKYSGGIRQKYEHSASNTVLIYTIRPVKILGWETSSADQFHTWLQGKTI